jgi:hypothetical protein
MFCPDTLIAVIADPTVGAHLRRTPARRLARDETGVFLWPPYLIDTITNVANAVRLQSVSITYPDEIAPTPFRPGKAAL